MRTSLQHSFQYSLLALLSVPVMVIVILIVSPQVNIWHSLTEQLVLFSAEIYKIVLSKYFFREAGFPCPAPVTVLSNIHVDFLPNLLFQVMWNHNIMIMLSFSIRVTSATHFSWWSSNGMVSVMWHNFFYFFVILYPQSTMLKEAWSFPKPSGLITQNSHCIQLTT